MNLSTFLVAAVLCVVIGTIIYFQVKKMKRGGGCGCGCSGCSHATQCHPASKSKETH